MKINYPLQYKHFAGVKFISADPSTGNRIKLDPRDFNELQDIWLQHIDNFIKAVRGNDIGVIDGCEVYVQQKPTTDANEPIYEVVVSPGYVYVNAALIRIVLNHSLEIPQVRDWEGFKSYYLILVPEIREFAPTQLGEPGMSPMAGRTTSHRIEIGFSLELVDEIPNAPPINSPLFSEALLSANSLEALMRKHNVPWFVLLGEIKIRDIISGLDDIIVDTTNVSKLMVISDVQKIATEASTTLQKHIQTFLTKEALVGDADGINKRFYFPEGFSMLPNSETHVAVYRNNDFVEPAYYQILKDSEDWIASPTHKNRYYIDFYDAPAPASLLSVSYFVDQHPQYLSNFRFLEHMGTDSLDHDNRYYTEAEEDAWRSSHNNDVNAHPTHTTHAFFDGWRLAHLSDISTDHDNVYTRLGHSHLIGDIQELQNNLVELSQGIGYSNNDHYIVSQEIVEGVNGQNKVFPITNELLDQGLGYLKNVRADISHDAVRNPSLLSVIDASDAFNNSNTGAFSVAKPISMQNYNKKPVVVSQSDNEVWAIWSSTNLSTYTSEIWFASYKEGDGFFSPATPTGVPCHENTRISATVISSSVPSIDQRVALVWHYNGMIRYTHIDKGQTSWNEHLLNLPGTENCLDPVIYWVNDGSALGKLHLLYRKRAISGKWAIYRRIFELDLTEYGSEKILSSDSEHHFYPIILQDKTVMRRVWYAWIKQPTEQTDNNNCLLETLVVDRASDAVYLDTFNVASIQDLNPDSTIAFANKIGSTNLVFYVTKMIGSSFECFYFETDNNGNVNSDLGLMAPFAITQNQSINIANNSSEWIVYDYLGTIYYRMLQDGIGQVKWNQPLRYIEFQFPPVLGSTIWLDVAVPIKSLNERVSALESQKAADEEAMAVKIREAINSMGLSFPLARLAALREKIIIETGIEIDNRRQVYNADWVIYEKFFASYNNEGIRPAGCSQLVSKGGFPVAFEASGLIYDDMGKIINNTGKVIKLYSTVRYQAGFFSNGYIRFEARGEPGLECLEARITSNMQPDPFLSSINWINVNKVNFGKEINLSSMTSFTESNYFGVEITLLPGGYIYDWALFLNRRVV